MMMTELEALYEEIGRTGIKDIQRYKGLGEMDFDQLRDTTMDVKHRILKKVELTDASRRLMRYSVCLWVTRLNLDESL